MILLKVGGSPNSNQEAIAQEVAGLAERVVFVHGASQQRNRLAEQLGSPIRNLVSPSGVVSTYTNQTALEILCMAYVGLVNKQWVSAFHKVGVRAVGLSGADGAVWSGQRKRHLVDVSSGREKLVSQTFTGRVEHVNDQLLEWLIEHDYLPVLTQPAISTEGELINTDNDLACAAMCRVLPIKTMVVVFAAPGLLSDPDDEASLIPTIKADQLDDLSQFAQGTMKKKVMAAKLALQAGVKTIYWGDSRVSQPVTSALEGKGTVITA